MIITSNKIINYKYCYDSYRVCNKELPSSDNLCECDSLVLGRRKLTKQRFWINLTKKIFPLHWQVVKDT